MVMQHPLLVRQIRASQLEPKCMHSHSQTENTQYYATHVHMHVQMHVHTYTHTYTRANVCTHVQVLVIVGF